MTIRNWNNTSSVVLDQGQVNSTVTPGYYQKIRNKETLPENEYWRYLTYVSDPGGRYPLANAGGGFFNCRSRISASDMDWWNVLIDTNGTGMSRQVLLSNGQNPTTYPSSRSIWQTNKTIPRLRTEASNKLVKKLGSRDIDLGVALGEARETAHFVQSTMLRLYRAFHSARKGDVSGVVKSLGLTKTKDSSKQRFRDVPDAAANVWLEYSYAVRPLLSDVFGALSALEKRYKQPNVVTTRARVESELSCKLTATGGPKGDHMDWYYTAEGSHGAAAKLSFEIDNPFLYTLSQVGLTNPLNVAWELVPFSFVVDWFIPVGAWFNGLVPPQGVSRIKGCITSWGEVKLRGGMDAEWAVPPYSADGNRHIKCNGVSRWKWRNPLTSIPRYHLVGATFDLGNAQIASGLSLLWSVGLGRKTERKALKEAEKYHNLGSIGPLSRSGHEHKAVDWSQRGGANWRT